MTLAQADKFIKSQAIIKVVNDDGSIGTLQIIRRERSILYTACGGAFHRDDLKLVN